MRKRISITIAAFLLASPCLVAIGLTASQEALRVISPESPPSSQYETFEVAVEVSVPFKNGFDSEELDIHAVVASPDGKASLVPAFYTGRESIWKVRYTPIVPGRFSYQIKMESLHERHESKPEYFDVRAVDKADGFLRRNHNNPFYLAFDSGKPFFGIGHNIGWSTNNILSFYEKYFKRFKENGCNLTRIWVNSPWTFRIDTQDSCCIYNVHDCEKLDSLLELARKYGIYIILSLDTYGALMEERGSWGENFWRRNPYNKANGGPCENPEEFFSNEMAKSYYKNRLRYIVARWSHSPNILAFELWNEVDAPREWIREMASYLKDINPHGQLVTTSLGYPWGNNFDESVIWSLDEIDIIERHLYGNMAKDIIQNLIQVNLEYSKLFKKPILIGEFGMDSGKTDADIDMKGSGVELHNSLWASAMTRSFAGALNWWWSEYVMAKNLYSHYKGLANFVRDVRWDSKRVEPIKTTPIIKKTKKADTYSDVKIPTTDRWGEALYSEFEVKNNGDLSGGVLNTYLHGLSKEAMRLEPVFHVDYPADGKFVIHIDMVSQDANMIVYLDDREVINKKFPAGPGEGPWKRSLYRHDYKIYQCVYDTDVALTIPKGKHSLCLSNTGKDWISIKYISLTNYRSDAFPNARVVGLHLDDEIILWIHNKDYDWRNDIKDIAPSTINDAYIDILEVEDGLYTVEWWDTFDGNVQSHTEAVAKSGSLGIDIPDFLNDIACKIKKRK